MHASALAQKGPHVTSEGSPVKDDEDKEEGGDDQVDAEVQNKIPLESVKPRVIRPQFADAKRPKDVLKMGDKLSELFRSQMNDGVLVFSDVTEAPNSCSVYGKYVQGDELVVDVFVDHDGKEVHMEKVTGKATELDALLGRISKLVVAHCPVQ